MSDDDQQQRFKVEWIDGLREPQNPPDPDYPGGIALDASRGQSPSCECVLPYPAKRCGYYHVVCQRCSYSIVITTAGRPDDPRSVRVACAQRT